jgi:hypothetical protein
MIKTRFDTQLELQYHALPNKETMILTRELLDMPHIKIVNSDKNLGITALDTIHYHHIVMKHLSNLEIYSKITENAPSLIKYAKKLYALFLYSIRVYKDSLTVQQFKFLEYPWNHKIPSFHCLPKLHKNGPLSGRPIIGAVSWITTAPSILLDDLLLQKSAPTHILKNSHQLKQQLDTLPPFDTSEFTLVTLDVSSLYTNIDIKTLDTLLNSPLEKALLSFVCSNNYFEYNQEIYKQKNGLAMGTNSAVNLANLYLEKLLDPLLLNHHAIKLYSRFIDDIFMIVKNDQSIIADIYSKANQQIPNIKLTIEQDFSKINFLDITIQKTSNGFITYIYQKELNRFLYLPAHSCHPQHVLDGFIKSELKRYSLLCTLPLHFQIIKLQFKTHLLKRGYTNARINWIFHVFDTPHLRDLETSTKHINQTQMILRHTTRNISSLKKLFFDHKHLFYNTADTIIRVTSKNSRSIRSLLLKSSLSTNQTLYLKTQK